MLRVFMAAAALVGLAMQSYEPPKLQGGRLEAQKLMTTTAGMVLLDLTVSERGAVTDVRMVKDVPPFGELTKSSIASWRFDPARDNRVATDSRVLVIGLYRPPAMLFPLPDVPSAPAADNDDAVPFPTKLVVPPYPPNRIGSTSVLVVLDIDERGGVTSAQTIGSETGFDDSAVSTARQWEFRPAMEQGRAVASRAYMIVSFRQPS
jgi:TonB family protein